MDYRHGETEVSSDSAGGIGHGLRGGNAGPWLVWYVKG